MTPERLAACAEMSPEELSAHYPSTMGCVYDTYDEIARSVRQDFANSFAAEPDDYYEALALGGRVLLERMAANPDEARFCFVEVLRGDHELLRMRARSRRRLVDLFVAELHERCGEDAVPRMQLELLTGAVFQAIASAVGSGNAAELPDMMPEITSRAYVFQPAAA